MFRTASIGIALLVGIIPGQAQESFEGMELEEAVDIAQVTAASRQAAEAGDAAAQHHLARCYFTGSGVPQSTSKGMYWLKKAAEQGYADAQCHLAERYFTGQGAEQNPKEACSWWVKAAKQHNLEAMYRLGMAHLSG